MPLLPSEVFRDDILDPAVRGFLHPPSVSSGDGLVLTHGAGGNAQMPLLVALAEAFSAEGLTVLRCTLPFRQKRAFGPPRPVEAPLDRVGLKNALAALRKVAPRGLFLGGQSYGGRQASMLLAEEPLANGLLLFSYPLHAPNRPDKPRTEHFPNLHVPTLFIHGTRDPFGSIAEIETARKLISARTELLVVEGAGHDLGFKGKMKREELPTLIVKSFHKLFG